ncbi:spike base protein, RCAP_Rcc01079 family [Falsirhodobacter xinxiangensis]|uniref:spike base protein, RCAP_Rcc01079 family n=1 Tax=Falsirhodobacter xinxiangensis TaxID=2530049 RepID=UPI0010AA0D18|nr:hypothetical protein [Rhodobacter xinxiangensis]
MPDRFHTHSKGVTAPALGAIAVTPSDSTDLPEMVRAVTLGGGGTLGFVGGDGQTYVTGVLPAGTYAVFARRIRATGTTASDITGWI